jgi:hypothetical protein
MVMYRVDGVSGLNVLTGIKSIFHVSSLLERQTIIPVPAGISYRPANPADKLAVFSNGKEWKAYQSQNSLQALF